MAFHTLLGPDYSGKSALLTKLSTENRWCAVSYDDPYVVDDFPFVGRLRRDWLTDVFPFSARRYSPEFVVSLLHSIVLHLRDQVDRHSGAPGVIVDSYYYKLLAKCRLTGLQHRSTFAAWRALPQPASVVYLDVTPECAWERADHGRALNRFEHYGSQPSWRGFARFQTDLRTDMLREVRHLPVSWVDATADPVTVLAKVRAALGMPGSGMHGAGMHGAGMHGAGMHGLGVQGVGASRTAAAR